MTYLIIRFQTLGSVAMLVPVLASVAEQRPDDRFVVVGRRDLSAMFYGMPNVEYYPVELKGKQGHLRGMWRLWRDLQATYKVDYVIDLQDVLRSWWLRQLFALSGAKTTKIRKERALRKLLSRRGYVNTQLTLKTEFELYGRAFEEAGLQWNSSFRSLPVNPQAAQQVANRWGEKRGTWIGIAPFAKHKTNTLPYGVMRSIVLYFSRRSNTEVFLFGAGAVECEMLQQWASAYDHVRCVAGILPLQEEIELMRHLDVMVCMDSANQHLSSLVGLRAVSVWCGTHRAMGFYGWQQRETDCVEQALRCRPCTIHGGSSCRYRNFRCREIAAEQIIERVESALADK